MKLHICILVVSVLYPAALAVEKWQVARNSKALSPRAVSEVRNSMSAMLNKLSVARPGGVLCANCLISGYSVKSIKPYQGKVDRSKLEATLKAQKLPAIAIARMKSIIFAQSVAFQTFDAKISVNARTGSLLEIVGVARRKNNIVEFAVLQTNIQSRMIKKYTVVRKRSCKRILFFKKCKTRNVNVARGYTTPELANIEKMMLFESNQLMKSKVGAINVYTSMLELPDSSNEEDVLSLPSPYKQMSDSKKELKKKVQDFVDRFPYLKELLTEEEETTNVTIRRITNRGFMTFSRSATLQALDNVDPGMYDQFVEYAIQLLGIPLKISDEIKRNVFDLVPMAKNSDWILYRILFQEEEGGKCKYVCVLGHNNLGAGYDFVFATFGMKFELAPDILVIEESKSAGWGLVGSSKTTIKLVPSSIKKQDLDYLFRFFDIAAFTRFAKMLNVAIPSEPNGYAIDSYNAAGVMMAIQGGVKLWGDISKAFKTTKTSKVVDTIAGEGFSKFFMDSVAHRIEGLRPEFLSRYISMVPGMYGIPEKYAKDFQNVLLLAQWTSNQQWNKHDMLFDVNNGGNNRWMTFLSNRAKDGTYNFLVVNIEQEFMLAPDVLVIEESKSVAGGIYESTKTKHKKVPRNLTSKDLKQLFGFFTVVSFKRFAANMGMEIPDDPDIGQDVALI